MYCWLSGSTMIIVQIQLGTYKLDFEKQDRREWWSSDTLSCSIAEMGKRMKTDRQTDSAP